MKAFLFPCVPRPNHLYLKGEERYSTASFTPDRVRWQNDPAIRHAEGYQLRAEKGRVTALFSAPAGRFYAEQTLRQLRSGARELPDFELSDTPAFPYRGFMIDCVRHFFTVGELKKLIDAAALYKLNQFHWHLTDDQGWRIPIDRYPLLTQVGSRRARSHFDRERDCEEYGGFYTKEEIREIVAYCAERGMQVIPEVDIPGHTSAAIAAYPFLSCTQEAIPVRVCGGIFRDILCAGRESTYDFVFRVLDEVMELFPSKRIHIGGDEAPKSRWNQCPHCRAAMEREHLDGAEGLQGYFTNRVVDHLSARGVEAIVWNDLLRSGNLKNSAIVQMWMDRGGYSVRRANRGGKVIVSDFFHYYMDYPYGMTPLSKTYAFDPLLPGLSFEGERNILGVEGALWTEHVADFRRLCYLAYPRFAAIAESGWSRMGRNKSCHDFERRFAAGIPLLEQMGVHPAPMGEWSRGRLGGRVETARFFLRGINRDTLKNQLGLR